jgi:hypothetical protein
VNGRTTSAGLPRASGEWSDHVGGAPESPWYAAHRGFPRDEVHLERSRTIHTISLRFHATQHPEARAKFVFKRGHARSEAPLGYAEPKEDLVLEYDDVLSRDVSPPCRLWTGAESRYAGRPR